MNEPLVVIDNILGDGIGRIELWDQMGNDQRIAAAARVSLNRELASLTDDSEKQQAKDAGLINRLMRDEHTSPFRHVVFQWRVRVPIFVERQWKEHRAGSDYNTESGRYTELKDEFYVPVEWRQRVGAAMNYTYEPIPAGFQRDWKDRLEASNYWCGDNYREALAHGVAPEQARFFLPVTQYTTFVWTVNALAIFHFLHLRNSPHAQEEIRKYAAAIESVVAKRLPVTYAAYKAHWGDGVGMIV